MLRGHAVRVVLLASLYNGKTGVTTGWGFFWTVILMAVFTAFNFLAVRLFARVNNTITWWKVAIPILTIIIFFFHFHPSNFTARRPGGFIPFSIKTMFGAIPAAGIVFSYLGFEQADQLAGEIKDPARNLPRAMIIACLPRHRDLHPVRVVAHGRHAAQRATHGFVGLASTNPIAIYPFAAVAGLAGLGFWATILHIDAFVSPFGTGMIYQTSTSRVGYGLARNRYYPQIFQWTDRNGVPWFSLIMAFVFGLVFLLPFPSWKSLVGLVTGASVLMYAGAPLSLGAFRRQVPDAVPALPDARGGRGRVAARLHHLQPPHLLVGLRDGLEARRLPGDRVHPDRHLHGVRPAAAAAGLEVRAVAAVLPDRHGHHLLAGPVRTGAPPVNTGRIPFWWDFVSWRASA